MLGRSVEGGREFVILVLKNWRPAQMTLVKRTLVGSISECMCEVIFLWLSTEN